MQCLGVCAGHQRALRCLGDRARWPVDKHPLHKAHQLTHRCTYQHARPWHEGGGSSARARTTTSCRARATGCLPKTTMAHLRALLLVPRGIRCTCPSGWLGACTRATGPCRGPMPTSRRGGFSTAGACRFPLFPAKLQSVFWRSCGSAPCSHLTCGVTRRSPSRPRPGTPSGPGNGERTGVPGIWATATRTNAGPRRPPATMVAGTTEAVGTGTTAAAIWGRRQRGL
jgi:hypothetical protein